MVFRRAHVNSTLLADGTVLVTGGTDATTPREEGAVYNAELWTPPTTAFPIGQWSLMAPMQKPRLYHSVALLLPDATVLSTGGGQGANFPDQPTWEIFTPPYLCKGLARPEIASAPQAITYGQDFQIASPDAGNILPSGRVTLVRLSSITHSFNMNQRFLELIPLSAKNGEVYLKAPGDKNLCPPRPLHAVPH